MYHHTQRSISLQPLQHRSKSLTSLGKTKMESYPPLFRKSSPNPNPNPNPNSQPKLDVPLIDLTHLDPTQLGQACRTSGLFRLTNHGIPSSLSAQLHDESKKILSLPFESKESGLLSPVRYFWGTPALSLSVSYVNWLEGLHVRLAQIQPQEGEAQDLESCCSSSFSSTRAWFAVSPNHSQYKSPHIGINFARSLANQYGQHMARIARTIFDALAVDLRLDEGLSASYLSESDGTLRVYRYPCCPDTPSYQGLTAHTDSSVLSILNQDDVGGLQILHDNQWFNVTPIPDTLIVNLGDMMQAMSNDEYKSVDHRVLASASRERMSLCYFAFPMEDGLIVSSRYKAFTYKEFRAQVQEDIKASGSKVGLENFRMKDTSKADM